MEPTTIAFIIMVFICVAIVLNKYFGKDGFSASERAEHIIKNTASVFESGDPKYVDWKLKLGRKTDAVEYTAVHRLYKDNKFTRDNIRDELLNIDTSATM